MSNALVLLLMASSCIVLSEAVPVSQFGKMKNNSYHHSTAIVKNNVSSSLPQSRETKKLIVTFGGYSPNVSSNCLADVTIYNLSSANGVKIYSAANMPTALQEFGSTFYYNKIYVLGGADCQSDEQQTESFSAYDLASNSWQVLTPFPSVSRYVSLLSPGDGFLYAVAGNRTENSDRTFAYNVAQATWFDMSSQPAPYQIAQSMGGCGVVLDGAMYYVTDSSGGETFMSNDGAQTWVELTPMNIQRSFAACVALPTEKKIIVAGGRTGDNNGDFLDTIDVYDITTDTWKMLASTLSQKRANFKAALMPGSNDDDDDDDGSIAVVFCGGRMDAGVDFDTCDVFDWTHRRWGVAQFLGLPRDDFGLISITI